MSLGVQDAIDYTEAIIRWVADELPSHAGRTNREVLDAMRAAIIEILQRSAPRLPLPSSMNAHADLLEAAGFTPALSYGVFDWCPHAGAEPMALEFVIRVLRDKGTPEERVEGISIRLAARADVDRMIDLLEDRKRAVWPPKTPSPKG